MNDPVPQDPALAPVAGTPRPLAGLALPLVAALTLGLAPFAPEPHVVGKVRWVLGGAHGMSPMDYLDLVLHGAPWLWLAAAGLRAWRGTTG